MNKFTATHARPSRMLNANPQRYRSAAASNVVDAVLPCSHLIYSPKTAEERSPLWRVSRTFGQLLFLSQWRACCVLTLPL